MSEFYSPVRGPVPHDEYHVTGKVVVSYKTPEEIEEYLQRKWPGKIAPIKGPLRLSKAREKQKERTWNNLSLPGSNPKT